jgi:uncharacterized phage protein (TIGR02220 family)
MAIVKRLNRVTGYTIVDNDVINEKRLKLAAKGLLAVMLSNHKDWVFHLKELSTRSKDGIDAHRTALTDLITFGYVVRRQIRNGGGQLVDYDYLVDDRPVPQNVKEVFLSSGFEAVERMTETGVGFTDTGLTGVGKTGVGKTGVGKSNANKNISNNKNLNNKKEEKEKEVGVANSVLLKAEATLAYWNKFCREGRKPLTSKVTYLDPIRARIKEGASGQDCVNVIWDRAIEWLADPEMKSNFNPATLFRKSKFEKYLDNWADRSQSEKDQITSAASLAAFVAQPQKTKVEVSAKYKRVQSDAAAF